MIFTSHSSLSRKITLTYSKVKKKKKQQKVVAVQLMNTWHCIGGHLANSHWILYYRGPKLPKINNLKFVKIFLFPKSLFWYFFRHIYISLLFQDASDEERCKPFVCLIYIFFSWIVFFRNFSPPYFKTRNYMIMLVIQLCNLS